MIRGARHRWAGALLALVLAASGCATLDPHAAAPASGHLREDGAGSRMAQEGVAACARLFARADRLIDAAGVRDAQAPRVTGFPYLRVDRFAQALAPRAAHGEAFAVWSARLAALDEEARRIELGNLPAATAGDAPSAAALAECRGRLLVADTASSAARETLRAAARVPPDYDTWRRALGLYPLTRVPFASGVRRWQAQTRAVFALPADVLPLKGRLVHYRLGGGERRPDAADVRGILARATADALGVPRLSREDTQALFTAFAPEILVDEASHDDRIGALEHAASGVVTPAASGVVTPAASGVVTPAASGVVTPAASGVVTPAAGGVVTPAAGAAHGELWVNFFRPTVYTRLSHALIRGRVAIQLNYAFWFAARPPESPGDLLAGKFDALIWRVTLGGDGAPLVFDTIHHCGCYHLFLPTAAARAKAQPDTLDEGLFMPQSLPLLSASERIGLRLSSGAHYLERVLIDPGFAGEIRPYALAADDTLRSLPRFDAPAPGGSAVRASAFDRDGFVPGSERAERFLFWPMGVANAGAMRQWGRHATAFVGMRHFDDPNLIESYFELP